MTESEKRVIVLCTNRPTDVINKHCNNCPFRGIGLEICTGFTQEGLAEYTPDKESWRISDTEYETVRANSSGDPSEMEQDDPEYYDWHVKQEIMLERIRNIVPCNDQLV